MVLFNLIFGFLLIFAGRNLFWLCVGIVGFLLGVQFAGTLGITDVWMALLAAVALGALGAFLAVCFEWLTVIVGVGFLGGGYLLMHMFLTTTIGQGGYAWPIFVVGGIIGMCLMVIIFDWTLILISSLLGATLIVSAFHGTLPFREFLFIGSFLTGVIVQYLTLKGVGSQEPSTST